jgi:NifU-like protein involved in Fe-S cluster formation
MTTNEMIIKVAELKQIRSHITDMEKLNEALGATLIMEAIKLLEEEEDKPQNIRIALNVFEVVHDSISKIRKVNNIREDNTITPPILGISELYAKKE